MALPLVSSQLDEKLHRNIATTSRGHISRLVAFWHLSSLDAPTVAVVWALSFAQAADLHLASWIPLLLASGTWSVYIGDRLLDARRAIAEGTCDELRERHYFHWRHRRTLLPLACCAAGISALLIIRLMPLVVRERDSVIAVAALAYFSSVHSPARFPAVLRSLASKELIVGALFTAGCAAPVISRSWAAGIRWPFAACICLYALLAWLNCAAIQSWESRDLPRHTASFAATTSVLALMAAAACTLAHATQPAFLCVAGGISAFLLLLLDRTRNTIAPLTLRALADLVLLAPGILLLLRSRPV